MFKQNLTKKSSKNQIIRFLSLTGNDKQRRKIFVQTKKKKIGTTNREKTIFFLKQKKFLLKKRKIFTQKNKKRIIRFLFRNGLNGLNRKWPKWPKVTS